jgi:glutamine amidotransferase
MKVAVVDYEVGNLYSVQRALEVCGATDITVSSDPATILAADRVVLPGVGAFADGIRALRERGLDVALKAFASSGRPLLGICLGMQLFATASEEFGEHAGLDIIPGRVRALPRTGKHGSTLKVPYVGWSPLIPQGGVNWEGGILCDLRQDEAVYLVHSFHFVPSDPADKLATYLYGENEITAAVGRNNVVGVQFHPEKSGKFGLAIVSRFLRTGP